MIFLRDAVTVGRVNDDLEKAWFMFPEVRQNWLGFSLQGNGGSGLGADFATALRGNLQALFSDYGRETITRSSHIEKVGLVRSGIGRDMISDFTTNLVKHWICKYTETFAIANIDPARRKKNGSTKRGLTIKLRAGNASSMICRGWKTTSFYSPPRTY